ncbi:MAG: hypothetical protein HY015_10235 [Bacteroidetes bacterium]|nr:hypothetical protein [Bacteroidota bacterium]MBI3483329.1 hypothetical protein [Bacteroidota bacterium]
MKAAANQSQNYQLGLLHFAHLLVTVDGFIDDREKNAISSLLKEEQIPDQVYTDFQKSVNSRPQREVYDRGVKLLSICSDEEKLSALVHLYRLSEIDDNVHVKEVRLLLYSLKATNVEFEDVVLSAKMLKAGNHYAA